MKYVKVNSQNLTTLFPKNPDNLPEGFVAITDEQYELLKAKKLKWDNGQLVENDVPDYRKELMEIDAWFRMYDNQVLQYNRCMRLGITYDAKYGTIAELDAMAQEKAQRKNEIKELL